MEGPIRILLAEDESLNALYMKVQLRKMGFEVQVAATGEEAVSLAAKERPDLILMDINLGEEMSGIEAVRQVREHQDIPVIFITGYSDSGIMERAGKLNPVAILVKPVDGQTLKKSILSAFPVEAAKDGS